MKTQQYTEWSPKTSESEGMGKRRNDLGGSGNAKIPQGQDRSCIRGGELKKRRFPGLILPVCIPVAGICRFSGETR